MILLLFWLNSFQVWMFPFSTLKGDAREHYKEMRAAESQLCFGGCSNSQHTINITEQEEFHKQPQETSEVEFRSRNSQVEGISLTCPSPYSDKITPRPLGLFPLQIPGAEGLEKPFDSPVSLKNIHVQTETPTCCFKSAFSTFCITKIAENIFTPSLCPKNSYTH